MHILIVKTSSMGDVIHTFPAITDLLNHKKDIQIDWAVESAFAEIPRWHSGISEVIPIHLRKFFKHPFQSLMQKDLKNFYHHLRQKKYDMILDAQGLLKSAFVSSLAHGKRFGLDYASVREPLASFAYHQKIHVPKGQHAISRLRQLFAQTFDYTLPSTPIDYGLNKSEFAPPLHLNLSKKYIVFLHATTWDSKQWPNVYWQELLQKATQEGYRVLLPWGSDEEYLRAYDIAQNNSQASVLPKLNLSEIAAVLAHADGIVSVDSGLGHLACALHVPVVGIYGSTNPNLTGMQGAWTQTLTANFECAPCLQRECRYKKVSDVFPACFQTISSSQVWDTLNLLIQKKANEYT